MLPEKGEASAGYFNAYAPNWRGRTQATPKLTYSLVYAYVYITREGGQLRKLMGNIGGDSEKKKTGPSHPKIGVRNVFEPSLVGSTVHEVP